MQRLPSFYVLDDIGLFVQLVADIIDVTVLVGHRPLVLADVVGKLRISLAAGIPALYVRVMIAHIAFPGRETDALHRLVEEELSCLGILDEIDYCVEIPVKHELRSAS